MSLLSYTPNPKFGVGLDWSPLLCLFGLALEAAGRDDSSMDLREGDMFIVRYRPIRNLVLEERVDLI